MNEEFTTKVTTLTTTMESYRLQIDKFTKEKTTMQSEIDELYTSKYEYRVKPSCFYFVRYFSFSFSFNPTIAQLKHIQLFYFLFRLRSLVCRRHRGTPN